MRQTVFIDTSALYAVLDGDDIHHDRATRGWSSLLDGLERGEVDGVTHSSVIVEATALVQHRLGMAATRVLLDDLLPLLRTVWVDATRHERAASALLAADRRRVSLVDWTSFCEMRAQAIEVALAFDDDFVDQGFRMWES